MTSNRFTPGPRLQRPPGACKKKPVSPIIIPDNPPPWPTDITWQLNFSGTIFTFAANDVRTVVTPDDEFPLYRAESTQPMTIGPDTYDATGEMKFEVDEETGTYELTYTLIGRIALVIQWIALHTDTGFYMQGPPLTYPEKVLPCLTQTGTLTLSGA